ncbi:MAG: extracellular solute-binding protein [Planctomycetes bacterium]|nr:extracellular solute-binding protein [Planctomycetota bacterium]MBL7144384.1 extracellular solute-binding protein [Phycisphaerae bacterium]
MKRVILAVIIIPAILFIGCDDKKDGQSTQEELLLYCGAGIRPPADELIETFGREYGIKISPDYAGSEVLLSKIKLIRQGDLYMPGDKHYVEQAAQAGMILSQRSVCCWVPTILVRKGNPKEIRELNDLLKPGIKLGLGDSDACAIGRTSKQILEKNNIKREDIQKNLVFQSLTVNELGMQIQAKALDAVIVWDATAKYYSGYGDEIPIPPEKNVISTVDIGVLKFSKHKELAEKFVNFVTSEAGQRIFNKHNYSTKPPE